MRKTNLLHLFSSSKVWVLVISLVFLSFISKMYLNQTFAFHFVDEEDNFVIGNYLLSGEILYKDLFSHHQPLGYILSAGIQRSLHPHSIYSLIKDHRVFIILYSALWTLLLVYKFGLPMLGFSVIYELMKYFLLGYLFLSESLVVYPLVYLVSSFLFEIKKITKAELFFLGVCFSLVFLLLSPVWPVLVFIICLVFYFYIKDQVSDGLYFLIGLLPLSLISLVFISIPDYVYNAFYINFKYYIPIKDPEPLYRSALKGFLAPFLSWIPTSTVTPTLWMIRLLSLSLVVSLVYLIKKGERKFSIFIILFLGLTDVRFIQPGTEYFEGFHLLPWFALLVVAVMVSFLKIWHISKGKNLKFVLMGGIVAVVTLSFMFSSKWLFAKRNQTNDLFINYSNQTQLGDAIKIMKSNKDTLFVAPDEWLVYWEADIPHGSKMVNYYAWMAETPPLRSIVDTMFTKNPPTFVYLNTPGTGLEEKLAGYQNMKKDGKETNLYVLSNRLRSLSSAQLSNLHYLGF